MRSTVAGGNADRRMTAMPIRHAPIREALA
jgi:hypothetical protein